MYEIGRLCIKLAGRDSGKKCVVVEIIDEKTVLIDGQTRRRNCNVNHLEPLIETIKLKKKASHADVVAEFKKLKLEIKETKPKKATKRPRKSKNKKEEIEKEEKVSKTEKSVKEKEEVKSDVKKVEVLKEKTKTE